MKIAAKIVAGLILVAALTWTGALLYWHFTLRSAILYFEEHAADVPRPWDPLAATDAFETTRSSGCRSLPYLVRAIETSNNPELQRGLSLLVWFAATKANSPEATEKLQTVSLIRFDDDHKEHRIKTDALLAWWKQDGDLYHHWWRVWSSKCRP